MNTPGRNSIAPQMPRQIRITAFRMALTKWLYYRHSARQSETGTGCHRGTQTLGGGTMAGQMDRRDFLRSLGVSAGVTLGAAASSIPLIGVAQAQDKAKGNI